MSVRQYIGARYVTKIYENSQDPSSAEWEGGRAYEPLTLVTYLNSSYLSKKEVPASVGDPANNPAYWVITGAYNGQILQLQSDLNDLARVVNSLNSPTFRHMSERKFVFIGDSYTQVPTPSTSFVGVVAQRLGLSANQYHNIGVSGDGMSGFVNQVTGYSYDDGDKITDVVVVGGINDAQVLFANSNLPTKIPELLGAIGNKFPNAVIWAGFCGGGYYTALVGTYAGFTYENVQNIKYYWEEYFNRSKYVIYMDYLDEWFRSLNDTDHYTGGSGLHPNNFGIQALASKIANYLKGGSDISYDVTEGTKVQIAPTPTTSYWTNTGSPYFYYARRDHLEYCDLASGGMNLSSPISLDRATPVELLHEITTTSGIAAMTPAYISTPLFYTVTGDSTLKSVMTNFIFTDTKIMVETPTAINPIANVNSVWYPDLHFVLPANAI